ncbi:MAG: hypothetical protein AAGC85_24555, partial [Bacteroidota bacterium]
EIDFVIFPNGRLDFTHKLIEAFGIHKDKTNYKYIATTGDISSHRLAEFLLFICGRRLVDNLFLTGRS